MVTAFALAWPISSWAQSLSELYEAARNYDATVLSARALAQSAQYRVAQFEALNRPQLALFGTTNAGAIDSNRLGTGDTNTAQVGLNARMPLFNRQNDAAIEQARQSLITAQAVLDQTEQDLIVRLSQAYFDVLAAQDTLGTTRASKAAITEQLASAKRNFEVGTATITDTREAQARFDLAVAQEILAENDLQTRRIALDVLVGRSGVVPRPLAVPVALPTTQPLTVEEWVVAADSHPAIRRAQVDLETARLETTKARAALLPTVAAVASTTANRGGGNFATSPGLTKSASVGVELNWTLYNGNANQDRIRETLILEEKFRNDLDAQRRFVAQNTRVAFFNVQSGLAQARALEAAESSSRLALEATQLGYRVGVRVNLDVLNAQTQLFQTQRELARQRYDVLLGSLRLRQASGQLTPPDIESVNRLLAP